MCAFIPAIANCSGAMPGLPRASNSGAHAREGGLPAATSSTAPKYRSAKTTSSREMNAASSNVAVTDSVATARVTAR